MKPHDACTTPRESVLGAVIGVKMGKHNTARTGENTYASDVEGDTLRFRFRRNHSSRRSVAHGCVSNVGCRVRRSAEFV